MPTCVGDLKDAACVLVPVVNVVAAADSDRYWVLTHGLRQRRLVLGWHMHEPIKSGIPRRLPLLLESAQQKDLVSMRSKIGAVHVCARIMYTICAAKQDTGIGP